VAAGAAMSALAQRAGTALAAMLLAAGCAHAPPASTAPERPPLAAYGVMQREVAGELVFEACRLIECPAPTVKTRPQVGAAEPAAASMRPGAIRPGAQP